MSSPPRGNGLAAVLAVICAMLAAAPAGAVDYFAGKSIDLLIGAPPAGGYDIYARALARHYGRNIPGNPSIIPKNMPGAASLRTRKAPDSAAPFCLQQRSFAAPSRLKSSRARSCMSLGSRH